jgi:hypothetical protein
VWALSRLPDHGRFAFSDMAERPLESLIISIRGQRVILDSDLAGLYGVKTSRFNEAFKRNRARFPEDFAFQLTAQEELGLRSQFAISRPPPDTGHGGRQYLPWVFTEHGTLMAATILRSDTAIGMSIFLVRAFVRLREQVAANQTLLRRLAEIDKTLLQHDGASRDLYRKLRPLLEPAPEPPPAPSRRMGLAREGP